MNIGIVTWFRHENYGTMLQAVALQKYLKNLGYSVELLNFLLPDGINIKKNEGKKIGEIVYYYFSRIIYHILKLTHKSDFEKKSNVFKQFIKSNCSITKEITSEKEYIDMCNKYDLLIFGSDQIWNPNWYHPFYFANYEEINTTLISYAASFGVTSINEDKKADIKKALSRFKYISTREQSGCDIVKDLINIDAKVVLDPTFLLSKNDWAKFETDNYSVDEDYILCYFLSDNINHWKAAKKFAKSKKMKMIIIPIGGISYIYSKDIIKNCGIGDFLHLIHNAKYVLTDSFHGTIFSLIYNKAFYVFERHDKKNKLSQNTRIYNLINIVNAPNNIVKYNSKSISHEIQLNYSIINSEINNQILKSKEILNNMLR